MSVEPRFEIGADYDGVDPRHHQVNEVRQFSNDKTDRIFLPECGAFYSSTMIIKDINTGKPLIRGEDYDLIILDGKATKESGMETCGVVVITNPDVAGVILDYYYVGGIHMTGYYLLEQLLKMYPNGAGGIISYDDLMNIPEEHAPAYHTQHVHEFYKTDSLLVWLERIRCGVVARYEANLLKLYTQAQTTIDGMYSELDTNYERLLEEIQETFKKIAIQTDEYILTDSDINPGVSRGYGTWQLITDSVLHGVGGSTFIVGSGGTISTGTSQIIRNTYIWKNIENTTLIETNAMVTSNKDAINEGESIVFTITTVGVTNGTKLNWAVSNADNADFTSAISGVLTINNNTATVTVTAKKDYLTDGNKNHVFYLTAYAKARKPFVVLDTSLASNITEVMFVDNSAAVIDSIDEDQTFRLAIKSTGMIGSTAYLTWTYGGGFTSGNLSSVPPTQVTITGAVTYVALKTIGNLKPDPERYLKVRVDDTAGENEHALSKIAIVSVIDSSTEFTGNLSFLDANSLLIASLDEGKNFKIRLKTNGGVGRTVRFEYFTNKESYELTGLVPSGVVQVGNVVFIEASHVADYVTRVEPEFLIVKAFDGNKLLSEATLMFNDTSKTPNFQVMFSKKPDGSEPIVLVNEGDVFYSIFQVPGWVGASQPPMLDIEYKFSGSPSQTTRVTSPSKTTPLKFDANNNITDVLWLNNNTLAIKHTAVADKALHGDAVFSFRWKTSRSSNWLDYINLNIIDTSVPKLSATWSSNNATLTPITSVDEMTNLGVRKIVYLWIAIDGNASTYRNLRLEFGAGGSANQTDLITIFPTQLSLANGLTNHIVTVEINNDFLNEGNEKLQIIARADNVVDPVFVSEITIIDNSVQTALTAAPSTNTSTVVAPPGGKFSEWNAAYIIFEHASFQFDSQIALTYTDVSKFRAAPAFINCSANTTRTVLALQTLDTRNSWGDHSLTVTGRRKFDNKWLTGSASATTNFINDKLPPSITSFKITTDANGFNLVNSLSESVLYYLTATIKNPLQNMVTVMGAGYNVTNPANGVGLDKMTFVDHLKVLHKSNVDNNSTYQVQTSFTIGNDRSTNTGVTTATLGVKIDWNSNKGIGQVYDGNVTSTSSTTANSLAIPAFVDSSKTLSIASVIYTGASAADVKTSFNEGDEIYVRIELKDATVGDVYSISNDTVRGNTSINRFSYHEFDSKDIAITNVNQTLVYKATIRANMFTDGPTTGFVILNNKTAGTNNKLTPSYNIVDSSQTPEHDASWLAAGNSTVISSVNEGASFRLEVRTLNLPNGSKVKLTHISGRPLSDFSSHEIGVEKAVTLNGSFLTAVFNFALKNNASTDAVNQFTVRYEVVEYPTISGNKTINVVDTSQSRGFLSAIWKADNENGQVIGSVDEGNTAVLVVKAGGGSDVLNIKLINNAGRNPSLMDSAEYDVVRVRSSDTQSLVWSFRPKKDNQANTGNDLRLSVRVYYESDPSKYQDLTLPINDISKAPSYNAVIAADANGNNSILSANEGSVVYAVLSTVNVPSGTQFTWGVVDKISAVDGGVTIPFFDKTYGTVTTDANGKASVPIAILEDMYTSYKTLQISFVLASVATFATQQITINDTSKTAAITGTYWSTNSAGTDNITNAKGGDRVFLIIKTDNIKKVNANTQLAISYLDSTITNTDLMVGSVSGMQVIDIGTYNVGDGKGHTWQEYGFITS